MLYSIHTSKKARLDIQEAIDWENKRKPGLANHFLQDLESKLAYISKSPELYQIRYEEAVRCALLNIFPYLIHFVIDASTQQIIILRILHTSRKPIF